MEQKSFKFKLGLFVIGAVILFVILTIILAGPQWRAQEFPAYTTMSESVQGLEVGAAVKFRGVPIGNVHSILIQENMLVRVNMKLYEGSIQTKGINIGDFLQEQVSRGYRCRLDLAGITGLRYIEIDQYAEPDGIQQLENTDALFIPSVRSLLTGVTMDLSFTLAKLAEIDFEKIGRDLGELLETAKIYLQDERLSTLIENLSDTAQRLAEMSKALNESDVGETMAQIKQTLGNIDSMINDLQKEINAADLAGLTNQAKTTLKNYDNLPDEMSTVLEEAKTGLTKLRSFAENAENVLADTELPATTRQARRTLADLQATLTETTLRLNETLTALTRVAEMLEQEPGALFRGKQAPAVEMGPN